MGEREKWASRGWIFIRHLTLLLPRKLWSQLQSSLLWFYPSYKTSPQLKTVLRAKETQFFWLSCERYLNFFNQNIGLSRICWQDWLTCPQIFKSSKSKFQKTFSARCWRPGLLIIFSIFESFDNFEGSDRFRSYFWTDLVIIKWTILYSPFFLFNTNHSAAVHVSTKIIYLLN